MDSFTFNLQAQKTNAIFLKQRNLQRITSLIRMIEVCIFLFLISKLSLKLPVAVRNSSEYLREFSVFMKTPRFVFLIGNVIIITLFAQGSLKNIPEPDFYHQLVHKNTKREEKDRIKKDSGYSESDKWSENDGICGSTVEDSNKENERIDAGEIIKKGGANSICLEVKKSYRRCETEILNKRRRVLLRRCKSENKRKSIEGGDGEEVVRISYPEDEMSSEEFRRTVEDFIARQQRIYRGVD